MTLATHKPAATAAKPTKAKATKAKPTARTKTMTTKTPTTPPTAPANTTKANGVVTPFIPTITTTKPTTPGFANAELFPTMTKTSGYPIPEKVDPLLSTILTWRRSHESVHEQNFVSWLCTEITRLGYKPTLMSKEQNVVVEVLLPDRAKPTTLFSCHTDTVHARAAADSVPERQEIAYDATRGEVFLAKRVQGDCLGADDGAGLWLMLEMIRHDVPGTYIFHRGEERGCIGSSAMVQSHATWLAKFDVAIAFDRKGFTEIITHQSGLRCASEKCSTALLAQLTTHGLRDMELSDRGSVTDTLKYRSIIPECYNLAVGYARNHGPDEYLDYAYLVALRDALVKVQWESLPIDRNPKAADPAPAWKYPSSQASGFHSSYGAGLDTPAKPAKKVVHNDPIPALGEDLMDMTHDEMVTFISEYPEDAAEAINDLLIELVRARAERDLYKKRGGF